MTVIAAIKDKKGKIYIAADRRQSWGYHQAQECPEPKVLKRKGFLLAGAGDGSICEFVIKIFRIPAFTRGQLDQYLHHKFIPTLSKQLSDRKYTCGSAEILIACKHKLFVMYISHGTVSVGQVSLPFAIGCGGQLAWGALVESEDSTRTPEDRLHRAVQAAARVSPGCDANVDIVKE